MERRRPSTMRASSSYPGIGLHGRRSECAVLDRLLEGVRAGGSAVLIVRGGPGFGKTALLDYMAGRTSGFRVSAVASWAGAG